MPLASGGHTFLARVDDRRRLRRSSASTLDDAAGEAFDKGARLLGLPFPGGPALERWPREGDPQAFDVPHGRAAFRAWTSRSPGLKTSLLYARPRPRRGADAARGGPILPRRYQHAIVEALAVRCERALGQTGLDRLAIGGGVAANGPLRERLAGWACRVSVPPRELCTDNAAMIASAARFVPAVALPGYLALDAYATGAARVSALVLYSRPGCHLCDDARAVLERVGVAFDEIDITTDDALHAAYLERIPVVARDGESSVRALRRRGRPPRPVGRVRSR